MNQKYIRTSQAHTNTYGHATFYVSQIWMHLYRVHWAHAQGKPGRKCSGGGSASWSNSTRGASGNKACRLWHGNATNSDSICFSLSSHENLYDSLHITLEHFADYYIHIIRATCWFIPANTWGQLVQRRLSAFGILQSFARAWHIVHNRDTLRTLRIPL